MTKFILKMRIILIATITLIMVLLPMIFYSNINIEQKLNKNTAMAVADVDQQARESISTFSNTNEPNSGSGTLEDPYKKTPWNDRIVKEVNVKDNYYIYLNVDPRNSLSGDDIIIEFKYYYRNHAGKNIASKLYTFSASVDFYTTDKGKVNKTFSKADDSVAGFTYNSGSKKCNKVIVQITAKYGSDTANEKQIYFLFF